MFFSVLQLQDTLETGKKTMEVSALKASATTESNAFCFLNAVMTLYMWTSFSVECPSVSVSQGHLFILHFLGQWYRYYVTSMATAYINWAKMTRRDGSNQRQATLQFLCLAFDKSIPTFKTYPLKCGLMCSVSWKLANSRNRQKLFDLFLCLNKSVICRKPSTVQQENLQSDKNKAKK